MEASKLAYAISKQRFLYSVMNITIITKLLVKIVQIVVFSVPKSLLTRSTVIEDLLDPQIVYARYYPVLSKVGPNWGHCQQICVHFRTACNTIQFVFCLYIRPHRPASFKNGKILQTERKLNKHTLHIKQSFWRADMKASQMLLR